MVSRLMIPEPILMAQVGLVYKSHWRFAKEDEFDWLGKLSDFEHLLNLSPNSTILVLGCGNSKLSTELRSKGHFVVSTDYSSNVCQKQKMQTGLEYSGMVYFRSSFQFQKFFTEKTPKSGRLPSSNISKLFRCGHWKGRHRCSRSGW